MRRRPCNSTRAHWQDGFWTGLFCGVVIAVLGFASIGVIW